MSTKEIVDAAVSSLRIERLTSAKTWDSVILADYEESLEGACRLRHDFEFTSEAGAPHEIASIIREQLVYDLYDLAVDGDIDHPNDVLLKTMDGEKKRGTKLKSLNIIGGIGYSEYKWVKDATEFTVYLAIKTEWENNAV